MFNILVFLGNAEGSKNANSRSGPTIAVWHIVVSLISGMVVCIFVFYIVRRSRRRWFERRKLEAKPEKTVDDSIYQDLDLTKMGTEDNYQSLTGNVARISEDAGDDYQNVDVRKTKEQDNGQRLEGNACYIRNFPYATFHSKLDWNDNLAAIFEAKLVNNRLSSSVLFYCFSRRGWHHSSGNVPIFGVLILI